MIEHVNPDALHRSEYYDQATILQGPLLVIGGQNGVTAAGELLEGAEAQAVQAMRNVLAVLDDVGTDRDHVGRLGIRIVENVDVQRVSAAALQVWGGHRTALVVSVVSALARPGALVEIDALATLPNS
ncbi:RidA family protein [Rothia halotolerans]|uniref:RidA family protein n=1 Tax=Rothia halotolerans TaxID=405770 RepID=UPI00101B8457|nr:RidA family protein [Rothia halotolerans]